jgi:hypothetical protein
MSVSSLYNRPRVEQPIARQVEGHSFTKQEIRRSERDIQGELHAAETDYVLARTAHAEAAEEKRLVEQLLETGSVSQRVKTILTMGLRKANQNAVQAKAHLSRAEEKKKRLQVLVGSVRDERQAQQAYQRHVTSNFSQPVQPSEVLVDL